MIKLIPSLAALFIALCLCHHKARKKWSWGLAAFIFPFPALWILVQLGRAGDSTNKPSIKGWVVRIILVSVLILTLAYIGDSPLVNNKTAYALKAQIVGSLSPNVIAIDGNIIRTASRPFEIQSFAQAGFALAGLGALFGLFAFRSPILIILSQSAMGFVMGFISSVIQQVFLMEMVLQGISVDVRRFYKSGFTVDVFILLIISLVIHWLISQKHNPNQLVHSIAGSARSE